MGSFRRFSRIFFGKFSTIFLENFYNFSAIFPKIFPKILAHNPLRFNRGSTGVQPGSRHYCKFTIKFTIKFTPILIKILQSTKFEGSHFFNSLSTFIATNRLSKPCAHFPKLFPSLCSFPFAAVFSRPYLRRAKGTNGRPSPCDVGGMWAIRGIISRITSLIVSRLTS